jgi:hypothetical protein
MGMVKDVWDIACDIGERLFQTIRTRREQGKPEKVLSVMTQGKTWKRADIAKLSNISEDDALQALNLLKSADKVIYIDVDEEPKGTFWRRI